MDEEVDWFAASFERTLLQIKGVGATASNGEALILAAVICGGHVLIEDLPGTGKSVFAAQLSATIGGRMRTIAFTPDLLPHDITGYSQYDPGTTELVFHRGPVFSNVLLVDDINRASPRTQTALLNAMESGRITSEGLALALPDPFIVIATQNPITEDGTYRLPSAQMDRFALRVSLGYPAAEVELSWLQQPHRRPEPATVTRINHSRMRTVASRVQVPVPTAEVMLEFVHATRRHPDLRYGVSPRAATSVMRIAQVCAAASGRTYVLPSDVEATAISALTHRVELTPESELSGVNAEGVLNECLGPAMGRFAKRRLA